MKNIKFYQVLAILFTGIQMSCNVLDMKPLDIISDDVVWDDPALVDAYMVTPYAEMSVLKMDQPQFKPYWWPNASGFMDITLATDEVGEIVWGGLNDAGHFRNGALNIHGGFLEYWELPYMLIRHLNELIERLPNSSNDETFIQTRIAEARFLRAFNYFYMVKRYGGVPLITKVLPMDAPKEEMYPARNTEQEVYDFIISEMDEIEETLKDLPQEYGRANQGAALALKSRAALYAGSIAQFGTVQINGLVGIPQNLAQQYYQKSYDASLKIQSLGKYELYNQDADKVVNFKNIFLKERNREMIFAKQYEPAQNYWYWEFALCPKPHGYNLGMAFGVSYEMVEEYEYIDGRSGKTDREAIQNRLWTMDELWKGKDPRFFASVWTNGTTWKGGYVDSHHGLIDEDGNLLESEQDAYKGIPAWGNQNCAQNFGTGFGILKMLDENSNANMDERDGSIDCPVFRYGEILLNLSEAAFELGKTEEALNALNQIRERAGIAPKTDINREIIRHERKVELAFEGHRYWDARRWRIAEDVFSKPCTAMRFILDYKSSDFTNSDYNTARSFKIQIIPYDSKPPRFNKEHYYLPITLGRTQQNTNLQENPGYN